MPSAYPAALDSLPASALNTTSSFGVTDPTAAVEGPHAKLHNDANSAINAIQATLGVNPHGAEADVAARLDAIEGTLGSGGSSTLRVFTARDNNPPESSFAVPDVRNETLVLAFVDAEVRSAVFVGVIPDGVVLGGIDVIVEGMAATATTGVARIRVEFERGATDIDSNSFDTATEANLTVSSTSGIATKVTIPCSAIDSISANDRYRVKISRVGNDGTHDSLTDTLQVVSVELRAG